ncbi:hypothetical protein ACNPQM_35850, partial [Streptomyces sp. NPDC056231]
MPKLTAPLLVSGSHKRLNDELHALHRRAGWPSVRELARAFGAGVASSSRIHDAFTKPRLPGWGLLELLVSELASRVPGGVPAEQEVKRFHTLWDAAAAENFPDASAALENQKQIPDQIADKQPAPGSPSTHGTMPVALDSNRPERENGLDAGSPTSIDSDQARPETFSARHEAASECGKAGDVAGAAATFAELAQDQTRFLGPDHPDTLATRLDAAYWRGQAGDAAGAA